VSGPTITDLINARLDDPVDVALNGWPYVEALRGVMREHRPVRSRSEHGDGRLRCNTCHRDGTTLIWPCATVRAVADAFSIDIPGDTR
jgi:hypothetical protein